MSVKFAAELAAIVEAITSYQTFAPRVRDLAVRHVQYGVQPHHYRAVGQALVGALAAHLATIWDDELEAAWRRAYNLVAETMMAAAEPHRPPPARDIGFSRIRARRRLLPAQARRPPAPCRSASPARSRRRRRSTPHGRRR